MHFKRREAERLERNTWPRLSVMIILPTSFFLLLFKAFIDVDDDDVMNAEEEGMMLKCTREAACHLKLGGRATAADNILDLKYFMQQSVQWRVAVLSLAKGD